MTFEEGATYTDFGSNTEVYAAGDFIEVESLGPLRPIPAGQTAQHVEAWYLWKGVKQHQLDADLGAALKPLLAKTSAPSAR